MAYSAVFTTGTPLGTDLVSLGDDDIRALRLGVSERLTSRFVDINSDPLIIKSPSSGGNTQSLVPITDNTYTLGTAALKWSDFRTVLLSATGLISGSAGLTISAGGITVTGASTITGALSGITTLAIGGALSGVTTLNASGLATLGAGANIAGGDFQTETGISKTGGGGTYQQRFLHSTGDGANYAALQLAFTGNATASLRTFSLQTIEQGVTNAGKLQLQPNGGTVEIGFAGLATTVMGTLSVAGLATLSAGIALTGSLTFATAVSKIIPGATSISHRNNLDNADRLIILDAGYATHIAAASTTPITTFSTDTTAFPVAALSASAAVTAVVGNSVDVRIEAVAGDNASGNRRAAFAGRVCGATVGSPTATPSGAILAILSGYGFDTAWTTASSVGIQMSTTQLWTASAHGTRMQLFVTANGATGVTTALTIDQDASLTANNIVIAGAGSTTFASFRAPHGLAPTSPVNGDMWTTTAGLFVRINGATVGPLS